jgi:hypothetical protein
MGHRFLAGLACGVGIGAVTLMGQTSSSCEALEPGGRVEPRVARLAEDAARASRRRIRLCVVPAAAPADWAREALEPADPRRLLARSALNAQLAMSGGITVYPGAAAEPITIFVNTSQTPRRLFNHVVAHEVGHVLVRAAGFPAMGADGAASLEDAQSIALLANFVADLAVDRVMRDRRLDADAHLRHALFRALGVFRTDGYRAFVPRALQPAARDVFAATHFARLALSLPTNVEQRMQFASYLPPPVRTLAERYRKEMRGRDPLEPDDAEAAIRRLVHLTGLGAGTVTSRRW